jgi:glycosyltransferase involved in cell wall biosynthesis
MEYIQKSVKVGYVLKMYPRLSETFIVNEILSHETAGLDIEIFSLHMPNDGKFHESLARVQAPVTYLAAKNPKIDLFWQELTKAEEIFSTDWLRNHDLHEEKARDVYQSLVLARLAKSRGITHLHAHFASVSTTVARLASSLNGIPYSFTAHAKDIFHEQVRAQDLLRKLNQAAAVITVSDYNLRFLRESFGQAAVRVRRVYNGLDLDHFAYNSPATRPPRIVGIGRLVEKKGFSDLVTACSILAARGKTFRCDIVGDGLVREELENQVRQLELENLVKLHGSKTRQTVRDFITQAAVLAAPCVVASDGNRDGLPTVLLESMALGTPIVSTDVTGIPEALVHGRTGLMIPQHDPPALADALESLMDNPAQRVHLATEARRRVEELFDIHKNCRQLRQKLFGIAPAVAWSTAALETV